MSDVPPVKLSINLPENIYDSYVYTPNTFTPNTFTPNTLSPNTFTSNTLSPNTFTNYFNIGKYQETSNSDQTEPYSFESLSLVHPIDEIYLDMDETIGHVSMSSIYYKIWKHFNNTNELYPKYSDFKWFFEKGAFRPGLIELLQYLVEIKNKGLIKYISIYTAATNYNNYVDWIARMMEEYAGIPKHSIDSIYDRENCILDTYTSAYHKEIQNNSILIDDKPWYSSKRERRTIGIQPYRQYVDSKPFYDLFDVSDHRIIEDSLEHDRQYYKPSMDDYSDDRELYGILEGLKNIFD